MSTYTSFDQDLILGQLVLRVLILLDTMENLCKILQKCAEPNILNVMFVLLDYIL